MANRSASRAELQDVVDINVPIVGGSLTGTTTLLEALCAREIRNNTNRNDKTHQVVWQFPFNVIPTNERNAPLQDDGSTKGTQVKTSPSTKRSIWASFQIPFFGGVPGNLPAHHVAKKARLSSSASQSISVSCPGPPTPAKLTMTASQQAKHSDIKLNVMEVETTETITEMREGTRLVLFDIPSFTPTAANQAMQTYLENKWDSFDCIVVVMNSRDGPDHEEHKDLLRFVQKLRLKKSIPLIVLGNKMDLCDDGELRHILKDKEKLLTEIFGGAVVVQVGTNSLPPVDGKLPVFIPISLRNALLYRNLSLLPIETLKHRLAEPVLMGSTNKLGREEKGRAWNDLSPDEKVQEVYDMLHKPERAQGLMEATNFDKLGPTLQSMLTSEEVISRKIGYLLSSIKFVDDGLMNQLESANAQLDAMKQPKDRLVKRFWDAFEEELEKRIKSFCSSIEEATCLEAMMSELASYHHFCKRVGWGDQELQKIGKKMKYILKIQIGTLVEYSSGWTLASWKEGLPPPSSSSSEKDGCDSWAALSPLDWRRIFMSILLLQADPALLGPLSQEILLLQEKVQVFQAHSMCCSTPSCSFRVCNQHTKLLFCEAPTYCRAGGDDKKSSSAALYNPLIHKPRNISESGHWGHLAWMYCNFVKQSGSSECNSRN